MLPLDHIFAPIRLPEDWELLSKGAVNGPNGTPQRLHAVISTPKDVITIIIYLECRAERDPLRAGWRLIARTAILDHTVALYEHPSGKRRQYLWYCPVSNATCMINFSMDAESVWTILQNLRCH